MPESGKTFDVVVVGAGVIGAATARLLSHRDLSVAIVDAAPDVAMGTSRANSAIVHAGFDCRPGSLMAELNVRGNALFKVWCDELDVPLKHVGSLVAAFNADDEAILRRLLEQGRANGVPGLEIVSGDAARAREPLLSPEVTQALWAPTGAITCPYGFAIACVENAVANGARLFLGARVSALAGADGAYAVRCDNGLELRARAVVDAAGLHADDVAALAGPVDFRIVPRKGEYLLLDRSAAKFSTVVFQPPSKMGKGVLVSPTVDGNSFAGPTAVDQESKEDTSVTQQGIDDLKRLASMSAPSIDFGKVITSFAGLRAVAVPLAPTAPDHDFIIRARAEADGKVFATAGGICSPGLTSAPAIAERLAGLLARNGVGAPARPDAVVRRRAIPAFRNMSDEERAAAIERDPLFGRIVCRCETVTEAEIVEAVRRGATTVDGVKRRTRAGMGRCQGGFCSPRVMEIIARELGIPLTAVTKFGGASAIAPYETR